MVTTTGVTIPVLVTAAVVVRIKVHVISVGKKVTGVHHVLTHRGKEEVEEVVAIIRMDPTIITIMGPIPQLAVEGLMDKNQDHVINAEKQVTGAPIVPKLVVVDTKEIR